jgi:hypothetical protein
MAIAQTSNISISVNPRCELFFIEVASPILSSCEAEPPSFAVVLS